jgi:hypothetical protein
MLLTCHERKSSIRKLSYIYIYMHVYTHSHQCCDSTYILNVCVEYEKCYDLICVSDWVQYRWVRMLLETCNSSPERNLMFSIQTMKLKCVCIYIYWVNQSNCAISIRCVYWMTWCTWGWILLQQYVITFCVTITECAHVGLRVATEFNFTNVFLVWYMTRCTLIPNLWRLHLS